MTRHVYHYGPVFSPGIPTMMNVGMATGGALPPLSGFSSIYIKILDIRVTEKCWRPASYLLFSMGQYMH
ncbi:hypothetical protein [Komagataeibacter intermedius]|uniref:hypothetical protein n=1 Tax=Komagataeibacter intermedius TaxID=66229 RepID=UPI001ADFF119|nr:hypothetical protein [Komagataeibacter intermedius]